MTSYPSTSTPEPVTPDPKIGKADERDVQVELERLRSDVTSLRETLRAYGSSKAGELRDRATAQFETSEEELRLRVREKPFQALGIAAGIGFLLGLIWR